jgi:hypothetical protein
VRQRDQIDRVLAARDAMHPPDVIDERTRRQELLDREPADRQDQARALQLELALEPGAAVRDLVRARHPVTTLRLLARKAAADRRHVHPRAELRLVEPERREPLE